MKKCSFIVFLSLFSFYGFSTECPREQVEKCKSERQRITQELDRKEKESLKIIKEYTALKSAFEGNGEYMDNAKFYLSDTYEDEEQMLRKLRKIKNNFDSWHVRGMAVQ